MNKWMQTAIATATMLYAAAAMADNVEVVFDVTVHTRGQLDTPLISNIVTPLPTYSAMEPKSFQWVMRFDLDQPISVGTFSPYFPGSIGLGFKSSTSATPITDILAKPWPGLDTSALNQPNDTSLAYLPGFETNGPGNVQAQVLATLSHLGTDMNGRPSAYTLSRSVNWMTAAPDTEMADMNTWTPQDMATFLGKQIGTTFRNGYVENAETLVKPAPGEQLASDALTGWLSYQRYQGDITLRSVTIVPEPGTWALMGLGLMSVAGLTSARRQRNPSQG